MKNIQNEIKKLEKAKINLEEMEKGLLGDFETSEEHRKSIQEMFKGSLGQRRLWEIREKIQTLKQCQKLEDDKVEGLMEKLRNCDAFFDVSDYENANTTDKFMGIVEIFIKEIFGVVEDEN